MKIYHHKKTNKTKIFATLITAVIVGVGAYSALTFLHVRAANSQAAYSQGFETNASGWSDATGDGANDGYGTLLLTPSGTNGIVAATGDEYALVNSSDESLQGPFTQFNGYQSTWPGTDWQTSVKVYLDPSWSEGSGFDWVSAINNTSGTFVRDFGLLAWVYNGQLYIGGSNQSPVATDMPNLLSDANAANYSFATISQAGWYTINLHFQNVNGDLRVLLDVDDTAGSVLYTKDVTDVTRTPPTLAIDDVGGHRYGWFSRVSVPGGLAVDDATLSYGDNVVTVSPGATAPTTTTLDDNQTVGITGLVDGSATLAQDLTISSSTSGAQVQIPAGTTVTAADPLWNGDLPAPIVNVAVTSVNIPGFTTNVGKAITVSDTHLTFDQPVKVTIPGEASLSAGYIDENGAFHTITTACATNPADTLTGGVQECYTISGNDLVVWTLHFSTFVAYSAVQNQSAPSGSPTGGGSSSSESGDSLDTGTSSTDTSSSGQSVLTTDESQTKPDDTPTPSDTVPTASGRPSVTANQTSNTVTTAKKVGNVFTHVAWYWWVTAVLAIVVIWIWIATAARTASRQPTSHGNTFNQRSSAKSKNK